MVISLVAWVLGGRVGWPVDAIVIAIVVILNAALATYRRPGLKVQWRPCRK